jgi:hypothetical protein
MTEETNGAPRAALSADRVLMRDLIALQLQLELFERALNLNREATENLVQRQVIAIPLTDEPDYRLNLIHDVMAVTVAFEGLSVHAHELLAAIERVAPVTSAATPTS